MMRKQTGNMYSFVTHTWNPIKGKCSHDCSYCYMKRFSQNPIRLDEKEFKTDLGTGNFIFVGSGTDMFAEDIPIEWIIKVFQYCEQFIKNTYLFQSKNPWRFPLPYAIDAIYGTTIETNRKYKCMGKAKGVQDRASAMNHWRNTGIRRTMVTIEPIMDFDLKDLIYLIETASPEWVNIGADSKGCNLPEPSAYKIKKLIEELEQFTQVKIKKNLDRLLK